MKGPIFDNKWYDFNIPQELIAQEPAPKRDQSRLLVVKREKNTVEEKVFKEVIDFFQEGDVLVLNNTEVIRARLFGKKTTGAVIEVLLLREMPNKTWEALVKPGKRVKVGDDIIFEGDLKAGVIGKTSSGLQILEFHPNRIDIFLKQVGKVPLPPYIKKDLEDENNYQTVYAKKRGAVAAPTAGLHFTQELLDKITNKGVKVTYLTLHCGLATFRPIKAQDIRDHKIASEVVELKKPTSDIINQAKQNNKKVIAVGTTVVRSLESAAFCDGDKNFRVKEFSGQTDLYITPGYQFKVVDVLITNFHTPHSTNLVLVCSFASNQLIKKAYTFAKEDKLRFYSFGDAMILL